MAQASYDNNGNVVKKPFKIKIAGFSFGLKHIVLLLIVVGFIVLSSYISSEKKRKEDEAIVQARLAEIEALRSQQGEQVEFDLHAQIQQSLSAQFGQAPEGFEWGYTGELVAIGDDDDHTCEDVVYMYIRALSILDFSTAQRYSNDSIVIDSYQNFYRSTTDVMTDYYRNFLRKQFKLSLTSLEVESISDVAVFADGTEYLTITIKCLDLTDKDFWQADRDDLFKTMRVYKDTENDAVKMEQFVYDYIYENYLNGTIGKRSHNIELVVMKNNGGGWLIESDRELDAYLEYDKGVDVAAYILNEFSDWYLDVTLAEQIEAIGGVASSPAGRDEQDSDVYVEDPTSVGDDSSDDFQWASGDETGN